MTRAILVCAALGLAACGGHAPREPERAPKPARPAGDAAPQRFEPAPMYAALFDVDAVLWFNMTLTEEHDDTYYPMRCQVRDVRRYPKAIRSRLDCDGADPHAVTSDDTDEDSLALPVPDALLPSGSYVATREGLFRRRGLPIARPAADRADAVIMTPAGADQTLRDDPAHRVEIRRSERLTGWCRDETVGDDDLRDTTNVTLCFRPGAGLIGGGFHSRQGDDLIRGSYQLTASERFTATAPRADPVLIINEVSTREDWFEVVNATDRPVQLDAFVYSDRPGNFARVVAFPPATLAPGAFYVQQLTRQECGFMLASEESLAVHRRADRALSDEVTWQDGQSPVGGSYARFPDVTGGFITTEAPTPGEPNRSEDP